MKLSQPQFDELKELLDRESATYNRPEFIESDPVQFPRMFRDKRDIEIAALLASTIAWGNRTMICRSANKMFGLMDWQPYKYIMEQGYEELPAGNIHRTFFNDNLRHYLCGLHAIYNKYGDLEGLAADVKAGHTGPALPWAIAQRINDELCEADNGRNDCRCLPLGLDKSALKRFNMALRWLVRKDGIVDLGIWNVMTQAELYIPLDVHVGNVSRGLGLLERKANDRRAVEDLTATLREMCPDDPVKYDYALFGIGVNGSYQRLKR
ncbi:MAG: TIGR02757 family protein [Bacteroidales bacterium]|nr:TIGR02757 family protein [Bacteroidales bacterium]